MCQMWLPKLRNPLLCLIVLLPLAPLHFKDISWKSIIHQQTEKKNSEWYLKKIPFSVSPNLSKRIMCIAFLLMYKTLFPTILRDNSHQIGLLNLIWEIKYKIFIISYFKALLWDKYKSKNLTITSCNIVKLKMILLFVR